MSDDGFYFEFDRRFHTRYSRSLVDIQAVDAHADAEFDAKITHFDFIECLGLAGVGVDEATAQGGLVVLEGDILVYAEFGEDLVLLGLQLPEGGSEEEGKAVEIVSEEGWIGIDGEAVLFVDFGVGVEVGLKGVFASEADAHVARQLFIELLGGFDADLEGGVVVDKLWVVKLEGSVGDVFE